MLIGIGLRLGQGVLNHIAYTAYSQPTVLMQHQRGLGIGVGESFMQRTFSCPIIYLAIYSPKSWYLLNVNHLELALLHRKCVFITLSTRDDICV